MDPLTRAIKEIQRAMDDLDEAMNNRRGDQERMSSTNYTRSADAYYQLGAILRDLAEVQQWRS